MRTLVAAIMVLLALVLTAVAVPAIWADRNVVQEDGFVAMAAPLGSDTEFQQALADATVKSVSSQLDLNSALLALVQPSIEAAAKALSSDPGYPAAWTETLRRSHRLTVADTPGSGGADRLTLDIAPLLTLLENKVAAGLDVAVTPPEQVLIEVGQPAQRTAIVRLSTYAPLGYWLAGGAGLALLLALVIARRRSSTLVLTGLGLAVVAGLWKLALDRISAAVLASSSGNAIAELFKEQFVSAATKDFGQWIVVALLVAVLLVVVGSLGRVLRRERGSSRRPRGST
ncbi:hypothetical protein IV500_13160 [Paeniglutamicibacter antarcticus]|uniref:Integral membrane protein n=1 Tax=Arthrobacter terrae TaxID=2935737 RepID=A0A931CQ50_9MICC|nr:hypothetical protein [Arthrobacter terrae]MBG0740330.1 hypothetical protein [Arthrobacter terrae]